MPAGIYTRPTRNPIYVIGPSIAYIPLTRGLFTCVDWHRAESLAEHRWCAQPNKTGDEFYAFRTDTSCYKGIRMQRVILGLSFGDEREGDHKNTHRLDNREANLRIATIDENARNKRLSKANKSGFKGVYWKSDKELWAAQIAVNGKMIYLGYFEDPNKAHLAYQLAAEIHHAEFARFE